MYAHRCDECRKNYGVYMSSKGEMPSFCRGGLYGREYVAMRDDIDGRLRDGFEIMMGVYDDE